MSNNNTILTKLKEQVIGSAGINEIIAQLQAKNIDLLELNKRQQAQFIRSIINNDTPKAIDQIAEELEDARKQQLQQTQQNNSRSRRRNNHSAENQFISAIKKQNKNEKLINSESQSLSAWLNDVTMNTAISVPLPEVYDKIKIIVIDNSSAKNFTKNKCEQDSGQKYDLLLIIKSDGMHWTMDYYIKNNEMQHYNPRGDGKCGDRVLIMAHILAKRYCTKKAGIDMPDLPTELDIKNPNLESIGNALNNIEGSKFRKLTIEFITGILNKKFHTPTRGNLDNKIEEFITLAKKVMQDPNYLATTVDETNHSQTITAKPLNSNTSNKISDQKNSSETYLDDKPIQPISLITSFLSSVFAAIFGPIATDFNNFYGPRMTLNIFELVLFTVIGISVPAAIYYNKEIIQTNLKHHTAEGEHNAKRPSK